MFYSKIIMNNYFKLLLLLVTLNVANVISPAKIANEQMTKHKIK